MVRIDSTVTEALMHEPSDSSLLWDAVRVMTRLLEQARGLTGSAAIRWRDHRRLAKKRAHAIAHSRGKSRRPSCIASFLPPRAPPRRRWSERSCCWRQALDRPLRIGAAKSAITCP